VLGEATAMGRILNDDQSGSLSLSASNLSFRGSITTAVSVSIAPSITAVGAGGSGDLQLLG
jgi:hypothetical protein